MDALVLDPHQDHPGRALPGDGQRQRHGQDVAGHQLPHPGAIGAQGSDRGPVVDALVQVVPAHLVDADGHLGLDHWVDPLPDLAVGQQLVHEESRGVPEIEDQRVAQRDGLGEVAPLVGDAVEQPLVQVEGLVEIGQDLLALGQDGGAVEPQGPGRRRQGLFSGSESVGRSQGKVLSVGDRIASAAPRRGAASGPPGPPAPRREEICNNYTELTQVSRVNRSFRPGIQCSSDGIVDSSQIFGRPRRSAISAGRPGAGSSGLPAPPASADRAAGSG